MRLLPMIIRRALCRHEWETEKLGGFLVEDGWLRQVTVRRCRKCGKVENV